MLPVLGMVIIKDATGCWGYGLSLHKPEQNLPDRSVQCNSAAGFLLLPMSTQEQIAAIETALVRECLQSPQNQAAITNLQRTLELLQRSGALAFVPQNVHRTVTEALFAPFLASELPINLDVQRLQQLLQRPPACLVPVLPQDFPDIQRLWPDNSLLPALFRQAHEHAGDLGRFLYEALSCSWPLSAATEMDLVPTWEKIGYGLPDRLRKWRNLPVTMARDREDKSIATGKNRRDLIIFVKHRLLIGGEDKARVQELQVAIKECREKHKNMNAVTYGRLRYVLLVATGGTSMTVLAIPVNNADGMQVLCNITQMDSAPGRCQCLLTWINISRWITTVLREALLPPPPPVDLFQPYYRPSPYAGGRDDDVKLEFCMQTVEKQLRVPAGHLPTLIRVYRMLHGANLPGAIHCVSMQVDGKKVRLDSDRRHSTPQRDWHDVILQLRPVDASWTQLMPAQMCAMAKEMLQVLEGVHSRGFVHRDVRGANIVLAHGWMLLDWELAAPVGTPPFWHSSQWPAGGQEDGGWTNAMDLSQLGSVLSTMLTAFAPAAAAPRQFISQLRQATFATAAEALQALPALSAWVYGQPSD